jgi:hypothetical protein
MKRRSFLASLAGLVAGSVAVKAAPPAPAPVLADDMVWGTVKRVVVHVPGPQFQSAEFISTWGLGGPHFDVSFETREDVELGQTMWVQVPRYGQARGRVVGIDIRPQRAHWGTTSIIVLSPTVCPAMTAGVVIDSASQPPAASPADRIDVPTLSCWPGVWPVSFF